MKKSKNVQLHLTYSSKVYAIILNSIKCTDGLIINKLQIGYAKYWLVFQNGVWRFVGDMPLCQEFKNVIISELKAFHGLTFSESDYIVNKQEPVQAGRLLDAIISASASRHLVCV